MGFSFLLVDYKSIKMTLDYIEACEKFLKSSKQLQYIIVDNSESGNAKEYFAQYLSAASVCSIDGHDVYTFDYNGASVAFCATYENGGYAKGNNVAAKISATLYPDNHFIVSNNDILFREEYDLDKIEAELSGNDVAVVGPNVKDTNDNSINPFNRPDINFILYTLYLNTIIPKKIKQRPNDETYSFSGCFWIFNRKYFEMAKGFDDRTFLYFEEQIMSERIRQVGGTFKYMEDFEVIHNHKNGLRTPLKDSKMLRYFFESTSLYAKDYLGVSALKLALSRVCFEVINVVYIVERAVRYIIKSAR